VRTADHAIDTLYETVSLRISCDWNRLDRKLLRTHGEPAHHHAGRNVAVERRLKAVEDQLRHARGFDMKGITRRVADLRSGDLSQGGSTLATAREGYFLDNRRTVWPSSRKSRWR
jgi:hypothetical protein